jgi:hypothetical protein
MAYANKDYIDVATRIRDFKSNYAEGSLQQVRLEVISIGDQLGILYVAAAYRHPLDERPGIGTAFEPVPAVNASMRGSEVMLAETSAWGRALVAIGADTKQGVASADEVRNRVATPAPATTDWIAQANELSFKGDKDGLRALYGSAVARKVKPEILDAIQAIGETTK